MVIDLSRLFWATILSQDLTAYVYIPIMSLMKGIFKEFVNELCDLENILEIFYGKEKNN